MTSQLVRKSLTQSPIILSLPHSGRLIPDHVASLVRDGNLYQDIEDPMVEALLPEEWDVSRVVLEAARIVCDVNRHSWEWDGQLFQGRLPPQAMVHSGRVRSGLGFVPRLGRDGRALWKRSLTIAEGRDRLSHCHEPYHRAIQDVIRAQFPTVSKPVLLLDCHSMPKVAGFDKGHRRVDICLGNDYHQTSQKNTIEKLIQALSDQGFRVGINDPFAGGYIVQYHGQPQKGIEAIQLEINRSLYWDEQAHDFSPDYAKTKARLGTGLLAFAKAHFPDFFG